MTFAGKVVAITGAAGGIGQALSWLFGRSGARLIVLDRSDAVHDFAAQLAAADIAVVAAVADIGDSEAVAACFARLTASQGDVDILVNNAGVARHPTIARTDPEGWRSDVDSNLNGTFNCVHAVLPAMVKKGAGAIVTIGSVNALAALGDPAYSAAKAGMIAMTRSLALEYGRHGVRVNIVLPGTVRTPIWAERIKKDPDVLKRLERWYPLGRIVEPSDIARAVAFLASDDAAAITGVSLPVDCGLMAGNIVMSRELTLEDL